jgi:prophage regulatory protein
MSDRLLSESEVENRVPLSRTQRWRLEKSGQFPTRIKLGNPVSPGGRVAWSESEIEQWIAERMAARKSPSAVAE